MFDVPNEYAAELMYFSLGTSLPVLLCLSPKYSSA